MNIVGFHLNVQSNSKISNLFLVYQFNFNISCSIYLYCTRCFASSSQSNKTAKKSSKPAVANHSFMANIFRGKVESSQVFSYPYNLNEEEQETLAMVIDPVSRFFAVSLTRKFLSHRKSNEKKKLIPFSGCQQSRKER